MDEFIGSTMTTYTSQYLRAGFAYGLATKESTQDVIKCYKEKRKTKDKVAQEELLARCITAQAVKYGFMNYL